MGQTCIVEVAMQTHRRVAGFCVQSPTLGVLGGRLEAVVSEQRDGSWGMEICLGFLGVSLVTSAF